MSFPVSDSDLFERFLAVLGITERKPSIGALTELVTAYMTRIPFENVSKLYYLKRHGLRRLPDLKRYIDGIECCNFGGTWYSNNYYLHLLLKRLGYDVMLCGADHMGKGTHEKYLGIVASLAKKYSVEASLIPTGPCGCGH